jgi:hypothetical protein
MPGREDLREIEPDWVLDDVEFAAYEPDSGYGDGADVSNDFLGRARDMGRHASAPHPCFQLSVRT